MGRVNVEVFNSFNRLDPFTKGGHVNPFMTRPVQTIKYVDLLVYWVFLP